ncbi:hypothetical protein N9Y42_10575 [Mariniblastus sp.]|nr:hypothetical protein [Mariniblastus sp.]
MDDASAGFTRSYTLSPLSRLNAGGWMYCGLHSQVHAAAAIAAERSDSKSAITNATGLKESKLVLAPGKFAIEVVSRPRLRYRKFILNSDLTGCPPMNHFYLKAIATAFATLILTTTSGFAQQSSHVNAIDCIPEKSMAYVHVDLQGLTKFQGIDLIKSLILEVQPELDELSTEQIGFKASQFKDAAVIVPPIDENEFANMAADPTKSILGILTFVDTTDPTDAVGALDGEWKKFNANGRVVYACKERGICIYHFADNAIIVGTDAWVNWFMQQRAKPKSNQSLAKTFALAASGQITAGVNGKLIPQGARSQFVPGLEKLDWAGLSLDLSDGVRVKLDSAFETKSDASDSAGQIKGFSKLAELQLKGIESMAMRQFRTRNPDRPEIAATALSQLATTRYGLTTLKSLAVSQNGNKVEAEIHAKDFDLAATAMICISAVQAIGTSANAEFEAVAAELSAK